MPVAGGGRGNDVDGDADVGDVSGGEGGTGGAGWHKGGADGGAVAANAMSEYVASSFGLFGLLERMLSEYNFS